VDGRSVVSVVALILLVWICRRMIVLVVYVLPMTYSVGIVSNRHQHSSFHLPKILKNSPFLAVFSTCQVGAFCVFGEGVYRNPVHF